MVRGRSFLTGSRRREPAWLLLAAWALAAWALAAAAAPPLVGDARMAQGRYREAVAAYEADLAGRPTDVHTLLRLADAETSTGEALAGAERLGWFERAEAHARAALAVAPDSAEAYLALARAVGRQAEMRGALQALGLVADMRQAIDQALVLRPDDAGALHALAMWHLHVPWIAGGRIGEVEALFERVIALEPEDILHRVDYAEALARLGRSAEAREQAQRALDLGPTTARERAEQARARTLLGASP